MSDSTRTNLVGVVCRVGDGCLVGWMSVWFTYDIVRAKGGETELSL